MFGKKKKKTIKTSGQILIGFYPDKMVMVCPLSAEDAEMMSERSETQDVMDFNINLKWVTRSRKPRIETRRCV